MSGAEANRNGPPDSELVAAAKGGDSVAFEEIVRRYRDRVYRLALGMMHDAAEAEEVVQDTFLNVFRALGAFRGNAAVSSWIYRVATNSSLMRLRIKRRKPLLSLEETAGGPTDLGARQLLPPGDWARTPDETLLSRELGDQIESAIASLPAKYRMVILLHDVEGLSNEEVAETLGLTIPTVKSRLHRSRLIVRDRLGTYFRRS
ncbi:MAG: sigma-70 family RNA polymerase sigma factor [Myxococcota bacterium]